MPDEVQRITSVLMDTFLNTAQAKIGKRFLIQARVNSTFPVEPHQHMSGSQVDNGDNITLSLARNGSVIYNDDDQSIHHTLEAGHVLLMDDTLWHSAAPQEDDWEEEPRVNLLIG